MAAACQVRSQVEALKLVRYEPADAPAECLPASESSLAVQFVCPSISLDFTAAVKADFPSLVVASSQTYFSPSRKEDTEKLEKLAKPCKLICLVSKSPVFSTVIQMSTQPPVTKEGEGRAAGVCSGRGVFVARARVTLLFTG